MRSGNSAAKSRDLLVDVRLPLVVIHPRELKILHHPRGIAAELHITAQEKRGKTEITAQEKNWNKPDKEK